MRAAGLVMETLYPKRCLWCGRVVGFSGDGCCREETAALALPLAPLPLREMHTAAEWVAEAWALYEYAGPVRGAIRRCKFDGEEHLGRELGLLLSGLCTQSGLALWADVLAAVPMAKREKRKRGYNQAELLANAVSKATSLPVGAKVLAKVYDTPRQSSLTSEERRANVAGAFSVAGAGAVRGKRILLLDDIITTGSTLNECAKMLLAAGAVEVRALCVAATMPKNRKDTKQHEG